VRTFEAGVILILLAIVGILSYGAGTSALPVDFTENKGVGRAPQGALRLKTSKNTMFFAFQQKTPMFAVVFGTLGRSAA
jgi:hypothetical protein